jgi:O-antigen/teichoic acid export membrane protein
MKASMLANLVYSALALPGRYLSIIRLRQFDTDTAEGRSKERYRRAALTALAAGLTKGVTILTMLVSVPLTLHYLGMERYGLWMTISSLGLMMGFADMGLGLGLMNVMSEAYGKEDRQAATSSVSSAFFMLSFIGTLLVALFSLAYPYIPWARLFNVKTVQASQEAGPAMAVFFLCFAANLPLGVTYRVHQGYQEGFINSMWESLGKVLGLMALLLVIYLKAGLLWLVMAMSAAPLVATLGNGAVLFGHNRPWLRPSWGSFSREASRKIIRLGFYFFVLQFVTAVMYQSHYFILAQILGSAAVPQYAVPARLFMVLPMLTGFVLGPLWPAYGEALVRRETAWVKKTFYRSASWAPLIILPITVVFVLWSPRLIKFWVGPEIEAGWTLLIGLGLWNILVVMGSACSVILNAANIFRFQIICFSLACITGIPSSIVLIYIIGLPGVIFGTSIAFLLFYLIPAHFYINNFFKGMERGLADKPST